MIKASSFGISERSTIDEKKTSSDELRIVLVFLRKQQATKMEEVNQIAKQVCEVYDQLELQKKKGMAHN